MKLTFVWENSNYNDNDDEDDYVGAVSRAFKIYQSVWRILVHWELPVAAVDGLDERKKNQNIFSFYFLIYHDLDPKTSTEFILFVSFFVTADYYYYFFFSTFLSIFTYVTPFCYIRITLLIRSTLRWKMLQNFANEHFQRRRTLQLTPYKTNGKLIYT